MHFTRVAARGPNEAGAWNARMRKAREPNQREEIEASLVCGTCGKWLWLLRSRPDQVDHATMRRGPPLAILSVIIVQKPPLTLNSARNI